MLNIHHQINETVAIGTNDSSFAIWLLNMIQMPCLACLKETDLSTNNGPGERVGISKATNKIAVFVRFHVSEKRHKTFLSGLFSTNPQPGS